MKPAIAIQSAQICDFGPFRIDRAEGRLLRDGQPVPLTPKAFEVLLALVEQHGRLVEKDELLNRVWADSFVEEGNRSRSTSVIYSRHGSGLLPCASLLE